MATITWPPAAARSHQLVKGWTWTSSQLPDVLCNSQNGGGVGLVVGSSVVVVLGFDVLLASATPLQASHVRMTCVEWTLGMSDVRALDV